MIIVQLLHPDWDCRMKTKQTLPGAVLPNQGKTHWRKRILPPHIGDEIEVQWKRILFINRKLFKFWSRLTISHIEQNQQIKWEYLTGLQPFQCFETFFWLWNKNKHCSFLIHLMKMEQLREAEITKKDLHDKETSVNAMRTDSAKYPLLRLFYTNLEWHGPTFSNWYSPRRQIRKTS